MDVRRVIGANVRRYRLQADLTQARVAELMGVDRAYVSALERGQRNPTVLSLWNIAEALGVHIASLFAEDVLQLDQGSRGKRATKAPVKAVRP
ncbi:helix-turn-helix domain-containing protein [Devosia albogilva]|uniref:Helix-turn-helix domain-containing protein n=1 Tax=Devosia albogilva TaxID=429726 RepID=A0ABW5QLN9_9HYPH